LERKRETAPTPEYQPKNKKDVMERNTGGKKKTREKRMGSEGENEKGEELKGGVNS